MTSAESARRHPRTGPPGPHWTPATVRPVNEPLRHGPRYGTVDTDYALRMAATPPEEDGPVWMVNLMKYREIADYGDDGESTISGRDADDLYAPFEVLADIGAEVVFFGDVEAQLLGDSPTWDRIGVVKYPTRRSFVEMNSRPDFQKKHVHKDAGMQETIVIGCLPVDLPVFETQNWAEVPHPPTDDDGPITVVHVLRFADDGTADMDAYSLVAGEVAIPHGVRVHGWFAAEGTIIGDGRTWDQVRFNAFPSRAAFHAVATDPYRLADQADHREPALADTYAMIVAPGLDALATSV